MTTARSRRRAPWADARFLIGIALVIASVVGVWLVVNGARQTTSLLVAGRTIVAGDVVMAGDLRPVDAALGAEEDGYVLSAGLVEGQIATRTIAEGEFVPRSALADASTATVTTVVVRTATAVPASIARGALVELWAAPALERGLFDTPAILVPDATVAAVGSDDGVIRDGSVTLELVIPRADVAQTLEALASGASLSVVPAAGR